MDSVQEAMQSKYFNYGVNENIYIYNGRRTFRRITVSL